MHKRSAGLPQPSSISFAGRGGLYPYADELLALEACPTHGSIAILPRWHTITTPLNLQAWASSLIGHPDKRYVTYILHGIACRFRVGFCQDNPLKSRRGNMRSAYQNHTVVDQYLVGEMQQHRILPVLEMRMSSLFALVHLGSYPNRGYRGNGVSYM